MVLHQYYSGHYTVLLSRSLNLKKMRSGAPSAGTEANCSVATHAQKFFISTATYRRLKIKYQSKFFFIRFYPFSKILPKFRLKTKIFCNAMSCLFPITYVSLTNILENAQGMNNMATAWNDPLLVFNWQSWQ